MYPNASAVAMDEGLDLSTAQKRLRTYASRALVRLRMQAALDALAMALTVSAWLLVVLLLADKLFTPRLLGVNVWIVWGALSVLALPYIVWRAFAPYIHERRAAVATDERLALHARLSTALTLDYADPLNTNMSQAFFGEATQKMSNVKVQSAFPVKPSRAFAWLAL